MPAEGGDAGAAGRARKHELKPGYRAFIVKEGDKYLIAIPVAEYDPDAASLTKSQIEGIEEIAAIYHESHQLASLDAVPYRYDPFHTAQNTGPKKGGGSLAVSPWPDDSD